MKKQLTVYTTENCHSCEAIKSYLTKLSLPYTEVKAQTLSNEQLDELVERTGAKKFPMVFAGSLSLNNKDKIDAYAKLIHL